MAESLADALAIADSLEQHFRHIHRTHMQDTPLCNGALRVEAVGFRLFQDQLLGIVLTPWFMNLVLTPLPGHEFPAGQIGATRTLPFPAGPVIFTIGEIPGLGRLDTCSLFSPVFNFKDHQTAVETAHTILSGLFAAPQTIVPSKPAAEPKVNVNRRAFLRGRFGGR